MLPRELRGTGSPQSGCLVQAPPDPLHQAGWPPSSHRRSLAAAPKALKRLLKLQSGNYSQPWPPPGPPAETGFLPLISMQVHLPMCSPSLPPATWSQAFSFFSMSEFTCSFFSPLSATSFASRTWHITAILLTSISRTRGSSCKWAAPLLDVHSCLKTARLD